MIRFRIALALSVLTLAACATGAQFGPIDSSEPAQPRQVWHVPGGGVSLRATVYRPAGPGPFPLVVISHGSTEDEVARAQMADPDYPDLAQWFLTRGYVVVIPQRPGHGRTGGPYLESAGTCERPDFKSAGLAGAQVLANVIEFMRTQSFVNKDPVILIGHSAGGWASLALAGQRPELVRSVIVFAAGRGGRSNDKPHANCAPDLLVSVAAEFGASARAPVVWIYAENDTYFSPRLGRNIATAYARGGAPMTFLVAPPGSEDGHFLIHEKRAISVASSALARTVKGAQN